MDAKARHAVVESLAGQLQAKYVFPDVASAVSTALRAKDGQGGYAAAVRADAFAEALTKDLQALGRDGHFRVVHAPGVVLRPPDALPGKAELAAMRKEIAGVGYGVERVEHLDGNVGYLEVRGFGPTDMVGPAFTAAMTLLSGTDALILDLRRNGGGANPGDDVALGSGFFAFIPTGRSITPVTKTNW
jgi:hypothetical protein